MKNVYITGDTHGNFDRIEDFCKALQFGFREVLVILGDVGLNYYKGKKDYENKKRLSNIAGQGIIFCVRGNHEIRPENISTYQQTEWNGGIVYFEPEFPNLLFPKDGEIFKFSTAQQEFQVLVIGGAYSVDKEIRVSAGYLWEEDEQLSKDERKAILENLKTNNPKIDLVLSHTCPIEYEPKEWFIGGIDQSKVDKTMENFLQDVYNTTSINAPIHWYCGHYHGNNTVRNITFLFDKVVELDRFVLNEQIAYAATKDGQLMGVAFQEPNISLLKELTKDDPAIQVNATKVKRYSAPHITV